MAAAPTVHRRRENSKIDKRRRIIEAARATFREFGFKGASMREIAKRAGVATGTLFLYAPDKRNLLLGVVNDELERLTQATFAAACLDEHAHEDLLEQVLYVFEARYRYWGADPALSLHALQELTTKRDLRFAPGSHLAEFSQQRFVLRARIGQLVHVQQQRGRVRASVDPDAVAQLMLMVFNAAVRSWLREEIVDVAQGIAVLRGLLTLAIEGCSGPIGHRAAGMSN
jgi:AcrR family transcriptional regulator